MIRRNPQPLTHAVTFSSIRFRRRLFTGNPFLKGFFTATLVLTVSLMICIIIIKLVGFILNLGIYEDPFSPYKTLMPGQSMHELKSFHCEVLERRINGQNKDSSDQFSCVIFPKDSYFDIINVDVKDNVVTTLTFYASHLTLGQLLLAWKPDARPRKTSITVRWNSHGYSANAVERSPAGYAIEVYGANYRYEAPVRIIVITNLS